MSTQGDFIGVRAFTPWSPVMSVVRMPCVGSCLTVTVWRRRSPPRGARRSLLGFHLFGLCHFCTSLTGLCTGSKQLCKATMTVITRGQSLPVWSDDRQHGLGFCGLCHRVARSDQQAAGAGVTQYGIGLRDALQPVWCAEPSWVQRMIATARPCSR